MGELLAECGHAEGEPLLREAELYRNDIVAAIDRLTDKSQDPWYIPWNLNAPKYMNRYLYDVVGPSTLLTAYCPATMSAFSRSSGGSSIEPIMAAWKRRPPVANYRRTAPCSTARTWRSFCWSWGS